jgi:cytoskeletal protein CcmA (bactofilin family)
MFTRFSRSASPGGASKSAPLGMSFIGSDVVITGNMETAGDVHVDGRIEGDIRCAALIQGDGGRIAGGIMADRARIAGLVDGSIATRELFLSRTARVTGDIAYESLSIEAGAQVDGSFAHRAAGEQAEPLKLIAASAE